MRDYDINTGLYRTESCLCFLIGALAGVLLPLVLVATPNFISFPQEQLAAKEVRGPKGLKKMQQRITASMFGGADWDESSNSKIAFSQNVQIVTMPVLPVDSSILSSV